jgi:hypothetical protein
MIRKEVGFIARSRFPSSLKKRHAEECPESRRDWSLNRRAGFEFCFAWTLQRFVRVETLGFDDGQRHAIELAMRPRVPKRLVALDPEWLD